MHLEFSTITDYTKGDSRDGRSGDSGESTRNERFKMPEWLPVGFTPDRVIYRNATAPNRSWYCNTVDSNVKASS